jgi:ribosomal protein S18 acetylase RimI-like enzyme
MNLPITFRERTAADESLLFTLFAETKGADLTLLGLSAEQLWPLLEMQFRGRQMTYAARYPAAWDAVIDRDSVAVGRVLLDRSQDHWRLIDIAVLACCRGQGIGSHVLRVCQEQCGELGMPLRLRVACGNPARKLYEQLGIAVVPQPTEGPQAAGHPLPDLDQEMEWRPTRTPAAGMKAAIQESRRIA